MIIYVDDPEICLRIRNLWEKSGYSWEKFCKITGISEKLYEDIRNDRELEIPYEVLKKICVAFSIRAEELLYCPEEINSP